VKDRWLVRLLAASLAYLVILTTLGRFPHPFDEIWFKAAGREWAATGRFAAPELRGAFHFEPPLEEIWLAYPPLYPALFGCFVKVFGFGWRQCVSFDALIHVCLALLTFVVARGLSVRADRCAAFWAGLLVLLHGASSAGRPEDLAVCFGMAGLLPLLWPMADPGRVLSLASTVLSGALFGLCAGASSIPAIMLGLNALVFFVVRCKTLVRAAVLGIVWVGTGAAVFAALIAPFLLDHPNAYQQYVAHSKHVLFSGTESWLGTVARFFLLINKRTSLPVYGLLLLSLATIVGAFRRGALRPWLLLWIGPCVGVVFLLIFDPRNPYYSWFLGPYILAATAVTLTDPRLAPESFGAYVSRGFFVLLGLLESTSVGSLRRARIFWISLRHLGRLTDVAEVHRSGRTREPRPDDNHGTNTEISPDFQMLCRSGQAIVLHP
jgi:hypothetical protein